MKAETRMELTRQFEKIRLANEGANSRLLFLMGMLAESVAAVACFIMGIRFAIEDKLLWAGALMLSVGFAPIVHALFLVFNRVMNRRLRLLYEAVLDNTEPIKG
jgi:hypothetical protein